MESKFGILSYLFQRRRITVSQIVICLLYGRMPSATFAVLFRLYGLVNSTAKLGVFHDAARRNDVPKLLPIYLSVLDKKPGKTFSVYLNTYKDSPTLYK